MRIKRLELIRFGCFTEKTLEFPSGEMDIHIIFGPNEAGKSTALLAIENLLFGIAGNSPYGFLHGYKDMRIGAVLENSAGKLEIRRRKGNRDTLLTPADVPVREGEGALAPYLSGADEESFTRLFCLDHKRLRKGGGEILDSRNEAGQVIISAGMGLSGLRKKLDELKAEAEKLWAPRAQKREYNRALDLYKSAEKEIRDNAVTAAQWEELRRAFDEAQELCASFEERKNIISKELQKLNRSRRVYGSIKDLAEIEEEISGLGDAMMLPEDANGSLQNAERELGEANAKADTFRHQLTLTKQELEEMKCDEELLLRESIILSFRDRRIEVRKERADLPNREAELAVEEANFRRLAAEACWDGDDVESLVKSLPERPKVTAARKHLNLRGGILSALSGVKKTLEETESQAAAITREITDIGEARDASGLDAVVKAARAGGDTASRIQAAELDLADASDAVERRLKLLNPHAGGEDVSTIPAPSRESILRHQNDRNALDLKVKEYTDNIQNTERDIEQDKRDFDRLIKEGNAVSPEELALDRARRDAGWELVKRYYVDGGPVPESDITSFTGGGRDILSAYEEAVAEADKTADRRFDNAQSAAELGTISRRIDGKEKELERLSEKVRALTAESEALDTAWKEMWEGTPFEPLPPESMLAWLEDRNEITRLAEERKAAARRLEALKKEEAKTKTLILGELSRLDIDTGAFEDKPLSVVTEKADNVLAKLREDAVKRSGLESRLREIKAEAQRKQRDLKSAEEEKTRWEAKWKEAVTTLGLTESTSAAEAASQLDAIEEMREKAVRINELRHQRIEKIKRDIESLAKDVIKFVSFAAKDLAGEDNTENTVIELERRLTEAKRTNERRQEKERAITQFEQKIKEAGLSAATAHNTKTYLMKLAGTEDIIQLNEAISKSDRLRELKKKKHVILEKLSWEGDGYTIDELATECSGIDISEVVARLSELESRITQIDADLMIAAGDRAEKRKAFEAIGGSDRAAEAAARKESARAEIESIMERYLRLRSAATMLEWAIERYRKENQDPMIQHASRYFTELTGGSFAGLDTEIDENDKVQIVGLREGGIKVGLSGMSDGTADQLYLALRMAAVEDYIGRSNALPFIADDLFINFDDRRSSAGLKILGALSEKTQVLFFTHHAHLVELARETLGESVNVISLG